MLKLSLSLQNITLKLQQNTKQLNHKLYHALTNTQETSLSLQHNQSPQKDIQPPQHQTRIQPKQQPTLPPSSPHQSFRISTKNPTKSQRILNKLPPKPNPIQSNIITQQQQHLLLSRKKKLLTQLNQINHQLKTNHQHSRITQSPKNPQNPQLNPQQMTALAQNLVKRMNQQRKQQSLRRKKSIQQLNQSIVKSIQEFHQAMREQQQMKQIKRKEIQQRIDQRKIQAIQRGIHVNISPTVLQHFISQTKNIQQSPQAQQNPQVNQHYSSLRMKSQSSDPQSFINPETHSSQIPHLPHLKTSKSKPSLNSSPKSIERSPFLERLLKEEERQKKLEYLKTLQKKRVNLKHREYAQKMRGKAKIFGSNSLFLT